MYLELDRHVSTSEIPLPRNRVFFSPRPRNTQITEARSNACVYERANRKDRSYLVHRDLPLHPRRSRRRRRCRCPNERRIPGDDRIVESPRGSNASDSRPARSLAS